MTADHFSAAIRHRTARSRRTLLGQGAGSGLIALLGFDAAKTKKRKKRCKRKCPLCQQCKKGKCRTTPDGASCRYGACQGGVCSCTQGDEDCPAECSCLPSNSGEPICASDASTIAAGCDNCPEGTVFCFDIDHVNFSCFSACTA